jgi:hypothetical protein
LLSKIGVLLLKSVILSYDENHPPPVAGEQKKYPIEGIIFQKLQKIFYEVSVEKEFTKKEVDKFIAARDALQLKNKNLK